MIFRSLRTPARSLALLLCLLPLSSMAKSECTLCIEAVAGDGYTELRGVNRNNFPVTVNLDLMPVNLKVERVAHPVVQPGESAPLARLRTLRPGQPSDYRYRLSWSRGDYGVSHDDAYVYGLPYQAGPGFLVSQGNNGDFSHNGESRYAVDFAMPEGTPVLAAREGRVVSVRADSNVGGPDRRYADAANYVVIQHPDGTFGEYLHLQYQGVRVQPGQQVARGELIGFSGDTGFSGGPHLHFMVAGATAEGGRRSFPVRFGTSEGIVAELQRGHYYRNELPGTDLEGEGMLADAPQPARAGQTAVGSGHGQLPAPNRAR